MSLDQVIRTMDTLQTLPSYIVNPAKQTLVTCTLSNFP